MFNLPKSTPFPKQSEPITARALNQNYHNYNNLQLNFKLLRNTSYLCFYGFFFFVVHIVFLYFLYGLPYFVWPFHDNNNKKGRRKQINDNLSTTSTYARSVVETQQTTIKKKKKHVNIIAEDRRNEQKITIETTVKS